MPLVVPPPRNITREGLYAGLATLQQNRIRDEERKRAEQQAEAAGQTAMFGGIGTALGAGLGFALAPATGGASLALTAAGVGAGVGGGLGTVVGATTAKGAAPGFREAAIGQGLAQATTGAIEPIARYVAGKEREEQYLLSRLGTTTDQFETYYQNAKSANPSLSRADAFTRFTAGAANVQAERAKQIELGRAWGEVQGKAAAQRAEAFFANPEGFEMTPPQLDTLRSLQTERESLENMRHDSSVDQSDLDNQLLVNRRKFDSLAQRVKEKPPQPTSMEELVASGGMMVPGRVYTVGDPATATTARIFTGRSVNEMPIKSQAGSVIESKELPGMMYRVGEDGKAEFVGKKIGGQVRSVGDPFVHPDFPDLGPMYLDKSGEPKLLRKQTTDDDSAKIYMDAFKAATAAGAAQPEKEAETAVENYDSFVVARQRDQEERAEAKKFLDATSAGQVITLLGEKNKRIPQAVAVLDQADRFSLHDVEVAAHELATTLQGFDYMLVTPEVRRELDTLEHRILDVLSRKRNELQLQVAP